MNSKVEKFFSMMLPYGAKLISYLKEAVRLGDIDGDGKIEAVVAYEFMNKHYIGVFKNREYNWYSIGYIPGKIHQIAEFYLEDYTGDGKKDIVIKWKLDDDWYELNVWTWRNETLIKVVKEKIPVNSDRISIEFFPASVRELEGTKYGYIDSKGNLEIPIKFDIADNFQENGLAIVGIGDKTGIIKENGDFLVEPIYSSIYGFKEGRAIATQDGKYKVLDESGKVLFENNDYIGEFNNGRAPFAKVEGNKPWEYGYINLQGEIIIPPQYLSAGTFNGGKAVVQMKDNKFAIIDLKGNILNTFPYEYVGDLSEGMMFFKEKMDGKFGLMDQSGNVIVPPKFNSVDSFRNGTAVVGEGDNPERAAVIDKNGRYVIQPKYNKIQALGEDRFAVGIPIKEDAPFMPSKYAIANNNGNVLTDFIFYGVSEYKNGLASVYDDKYTYIIDKQGKRVENLPKLEGAGTLEVNNDILKADIDNRISYYDKSGKPIWRQNTEILLNNGYAINEKKYKPNLNYLVYYPQLSGVRDKNKEKLINDKLITLSKVKEVNDAKGEYTYTGDFNISIFKKDLLGIEFWGYNYPYGAAHGMPSRVYAHVNLKNGNFYELKDLFKKNSDYVKKLSDIIQKQIDVKGEELGVWKDQYKGIKPDQPFYVTENALHIYFEPYEIAPYASGFVTFDIPFTEIMDIIDTKGGFWRAFN